MSRLISTLIAALAIAASACGPNTGPATPTPTHPTPAPAPPGAIKTPVAAVQVPVQAAPTGRLGGVTRPVSYTLEMDLDPAKTIFHGRVYIDIALDKPASSVWLHGRNLIITGAKLRVGSRVSVLTPLDAPRDSELLGFGFGRTVTSKRARLELSFDGIFGLATGAFRQQRKGEWYAYTDFEPIDARAAFPCFDDPRFKVPWTVSLVVPAAHHGFANTPQTKEQPLDGARKRLTFATTPPLPSYLVAFAAGPFEIIEGATEPVPQRIIAFKGSAARAKLATDAMPAMLRHLETYLGDKTPYRKIDLIAVPKFSGAMENPGLITVAERILLPDLAAASADHKLLSLLVIAHELAHLWFGDLVTPDYWNDLWMNEAFATWMSGKLVGAYRPGLSRRLWEIGDRDGAMREDERLDARAIRQPIKSRSDIRGAFNAITYRKGAAVLGMFEAWIGEQKFRAGIRAYLGAHRHGTGTVSDLLGALSKAAGRDIAGPMRTFLDQSGIPQISSELTCRNGTATLTLSQSRYLPLGPASRTPSGQREQRWHVPVCVRVGPDAKDVTCALVTGATKTVTLSRCPGWIYPNANATGYYRFRMPVAGLMSAAARGTLTPRERLDLASNLDAMMRNGELPVAAVMDGIRTLTRSADRRGMALLVTSLTRLARSALVRSDRAKFARWIRSVLGKRARALSITARYGESAQDLLMRPGLIELVGLYGRDRSIRRATRRRLAAWLAGDTMPDSELAIAIARVAAASATPRVFARIRRVLAAETVRSRRRVFVAALAMTRGRARIEQTVRLALAAAPLRRNEGFGLLRSLLRNSASRVDAWRALRRNGPKLLARSPARFTQYLPLLARGLCGAGNATEVRSFFDDLLRTSNVFTEKAAHSVQDCARLGDAYRAPLRRYLRKR